MIIQQYQQYLDMMNQWLIICEEGRHLDKYFKERDYKNIAVYGMAVYGRALVRDLQKTDIHILYGIDRQVMKPYLNVNVCQPENIQEKPDVIVNTVLQEHEAISRWLKGLYNIETVSLEEVVFESY